MAPTKDETIDTLRDTIQKLESRVHQLEAKLNPASIDAPSREKSRSSQSVRMILMGPPGAGTEMPSCASPFAC